MRVILDTNFIIHSLKYKIDIVEGLRNVGVSEIYVLDKTVDELEKLNAKLALKFVKKFKILKTKQGNVDDLLVELVKKGDLVGTQDRELKRRLKNKVRFVVIRQKKYYKII